jgi:FlaA1/EpsC-like NDP-sugar epimerase
MTVAIRGSHVLITGGTGSFGHRVAARIRDLGPRRVTIFSRDEKKQYEMRFEYPELRYVIGDVRDPASVSDAMRGVDIVFHAAALKQVPSSETWPLQAVMTNVIGSSNVFRAARDAGVKAVIALSTDKAVKPVNAMGMTKGLMEKLVGQFGAEREPGGTVFAVVRYGNVLGSRGSVVPVFRSQIEGGGPVTLTVPQMTRFLLTLDEAVGLVFYAMEQAQGGEVFVRKAPACRVDALAEAMIRRYGKGRRIETKIVGMRPGEKLHEVLVNEYEMLRAVDLGEFFVIPPEQHPDEASGKAGAQFPEYTSDVTRQVTSIAEIEQLLASVEEQVEAPA